MNEYHKRWNTSAGVLLYNSVLRNIKKGQSLSLINDLGKHEGKWDLRGFSFPKTESLEIIDREVELPRGGLVYRNVHFNDIDFSFADFDYTYWESCMFVNCIFLSTSFVKSSFKACDFDSNEFEKADFSESFLSLNIGENSGSFQKIRFLKCNFNKAIFRFPVISDCIFEHCRLNEIDFDGSRMKNVKFIGRFDSGWIRGYSLFAKKRSNFFLKKINPLDYPNSMDNVDFSASDLEDITFSHDVDLSKCSFPIGEQYLLVKHLEKTYSCVKMVIEKEWKGEYKRVGLFMIDNHYYSKEKQRMNIDFIRQMPSDFPDANFGLSLFLLISQCNSSST